MKILLAFDKYKGSLSASEVSEAVKVGFRGSFPDVDYDIRPIADGGEGFTSTLVQCMGGTLQTAKVEDALGREVEAEWGLIPWGEGMKAGVIEMSAASGLWRIAEEERNIMQASTYGTGQLIKIAAAYPEVAHLYVGLGGSATNDMGTGMAQALGISLEGVEDRACPDSLISATAINKDSRIPLPPITVACDVDNPLCGERGASAIFGPQKGATPELVKALDTLLDKTSRLTAQPELALTPGAGAAGGLGFGMMAFADATLVSGFDLVAEAIALEETIKKADLVITGEGGLDAQSLSGKGPIGVAKLAKKHGKPCLAIAGIIDKDVDWTPYFHQTIAVADNGLPLPELLANANRYLTDAAALIAASYQASL